MTGRREALERGRSAVIGARGRAGPLLSRVVFWWDGGGLWFTTARASVRDALRADAGAVAYAPPTSPGEAGALVHGDARVYGFHDPFGLALHAPTISTAMAALGVRHASTVVGYAWDAAASPAHWLPRHQVVVRLSADRVRAVDPPDPQPGVAPALPAAVPPDVRRAVAGGRQVVLGYDDGGLEVTPAVWGAGFALRTPPSLTPPAGARAAVAVDRGPASRPTDLVGLLLSGEIEDGALRVEEATWWNGSEEATVAVALPSPTAPGGVDLPD